jgi:hypothetical protein
MHNIRNHKPGSKTLICGWEGCKRRFSDETKLENHRKTHSGKYIEFTNGPIKRVVKIWLH